MLKFALPGVPVTVHWSFAIVAIFGFGIYETGLEIAAFTAAVFVAVLLHESGHAFTAKAYGATNVTVTLFALGGYTQWVPKPTMGPGKRFVVSAAGSAVGIALGLLTSRFVQVGILGTTFGNDVGAEGFLQAFLATIVLVGLLWGVLNWIPLLPLDGGHMLQHALEIFWPKHAANVALGVSTVVGIGLIAAAFYFRQTFLALFLMFIVFSGWRSRTQPAQQAKPPSSPAEPTAQPDGESEPPAFPI